MSIYDYPRLVSFDEGDLYSEVMCPCGKILVLWANAEEWAHHEPPFPRCKKYKIKYQFELEEKDIT